MTDTLIKAVEAGSAQWKAAFNRGDGAGCAACYEEAASMTAKPFGTFNGRPAIQQFWDNLIADGYVQVEYLDPKIAVIDDRSAIISAGWTMNRARGIITKELWVLQEDGTALMREDHFEAQE